MHGQGNLNPDDELKEKKLKSDVPFKQSQDAGYTGQGNGHCDSQM